MQEHYQHDKVELHMHLSDSSSNEMRFSRITEVVFCLFVCFTRLGQVITIKAKVTRAFSTSMEVRGSYFFFCLLVLISSLFIEGR